MGNFPTEACSKQPAAFSGRPCVSEPSRIDRDITPYCFQCSGSAGIDRNRPEYGGAHASSVSTASSNSVRGVYPASWDLCESLSLRTVRSWAST